MLINIYCDESGHLEKDKVGVMVIGALWCPAVKSREIAHKIREIKKNHGLKPDFEFKWVKVSPSKENFYLDVIKYFLEENDLQFRGVVIPDKSILNHKDHKQTHDDWYYKMFFILLSRIIDPRERFRIFLDYKDTRGRMKIEKLHEVLSNDKLDFDRTIIESIQTIRSHEVEQAQMVDLLIGSISYANRQLGTSNAKLKLVNLIREATGYSLTKTTLLREKKLNLLIWEPRGE
jgi:hypothetical protein